MSLAETDCVHARKPTIHNGVRFVRRFQILMFAPQHGVSTADAG